MNVNEDFVKIKKKKNWVGFRGGARVGGSGWM